MTARVGNVIEQWSVVGEDPEPWAADLADLEWAREDAEAYQRRHGGVLVRRTVTDWHVPGQEPRPLPSRDEIARAIDAAWQDPTIQVYKQTWGQYLADAVLALFYAPLPSKGDAKLPVNQPPERNVEAERIARAIERRKRDMAEGYADMARAMLEVGMDEAARIARQGGAS